MKVKLDWYKLLSILVMILCIILMIITIIGMF